MNNELIEQVRTRLKEVCPGEAYHAKSQFEAEWVANEMMDNCARLIDALHSLPEEIIKTLEYYANDKRYWDERYSLHSEKAKKALELLQPSPGIAACTGRHTRTAPSEDHQ